MAGPPQLSDPKFRQFSEAGTPDTGTGQAIAAAADAAVNITGVVAKTKLQNEVEAARRNFFEQLNKIDPNDPISGDAPNADPASVSVDIDTVVGAAKTPGPRQVELELQDFAGELADVKRGVDQGITPVRALEINVEAITRRYIDRFPGLSREFQQIAQTALGTQNNLLTASMRAVEELSRAQQAVQTDQQLMLEKLGERNPLVFSHNVSTRNRAIIHEITSLQNEMESRTLKSFNDLQRERGVLTIPAELFQRQMGIATNDMLIGFEKAISSALPARFEGQGIMSIASDVSALSDQERVEMGARLEQAKQVQLMQLTQIGADMELNPSQQNVVTSREEQLTAMYDNMIESVNLGRLNDQMKFTTEIIQNSNLREFEAVLGRHALIMKNIIALLPPGQSLHNRFFSDDAQQQLAPLLADFAGFMALDDVLRNAGEDATTPEMKEVKDVFNRANVEALRTSIFKPGDPGTANADPVQMLRAMDLEFNTGSPEAKKAMLDLIGTEEFKNFFLGQSPDARAAIRSLGRKTADYGAVLLNRLGEETLTTIGEPLLRLQFGIRTIGDDTFRPAKEGEKARGPVTTGDIVNFTIDDRGLRVSPKSASELEALGIDPSPENMANVQRMVTTWNNRLITQINSYARALATLDPEGDRKSYISQALRMTQQDADVRETE